MFSPIAQKRNLQRVLEFSQKIPICVSVFDWKTTHSKIAIAFKGGHDESPFSI